MKIIDCFTFYNELKMLEFRLEELYNVVDNFVLVEANYTFSGKKKEFTFEENKDKFSKYLDKIIHIKVEDMPNTTNAWDNEYFQRRCISRGIEQIDLTDNDLLIIADCDEIPDPEILNKIKGNIINNIVCLNMDMYYYNVECKGDSWFHCKLLNYGTYNNIFNKDCESVRMAHNKLRLGSVKCGWHFSYFGTPEFIKNKIENFSHQEYNNPKFTDLSKIKQQIDDCDDLFFRNNKTTHNFKRVRISENSYLPKNYKMLI